MKFEKLWEQYQHYTRDITEHGRKLGFAGAAICWVFKENDYSFPDLIYVSLLLFVVYFLLDVFHALSGALMIKFFTERAEDKLWKETNSIDGDIEKPRWVDRPAFALFFLKCGALLAAFGAIGLYLMGVVSGSTN